MRGGGSHGDAHPRHRAPIVVSALVALLLLAAVSGCERDPTTSDRPPRIQTNAGRAAPTLFTDITDQVGLHFIHPTGRRGEYFYPEIMCGGAAVFDYDDDGDLDVYLVNGADRAISRDAREAPRNRLFRQESDGSFSDVTELSGLGDTGYGMGCAVGDIDNDGDRDVYITNWGGDKLYRNNGDGTFTDITKAAQISNDRWSSSAAFLDFDRDGFLDLYVTNYLRYDPQQVCTDDAGRPDYCGPNSAPGVADVLYHNEGGMRFKDVSRQAGIATVQDAGLGILCADFNADGWPDIYVANDADPNNLWINRGDGTFVDEALMRGVAYNRSGQAEAGMGVTGGDADGDGDLDLFITHLIGETNTYYRNVGSGDFEDVTAAVGLALPSVDLTMFGACFFDFDNDSDLDLAAVSGAVKRRPAALTSADPFWKDYTEPNLLFGNDGRGGFATACEDAGAFCRLIEVSRALIPADIDNDGDLDLLVTTADGPARLFRNESSGAHAWLTVRAMLPRLKRAAFGARIDVFLPDRRLTGFSLSPGSYQSSGEPVAHFGLGDVERFDRIEVTWPDGGRETFPGGAARRRIVLRKGEGRRPPP